MKLKFVSKAAKEIAVVEISLEKAHSALGRLEKAFLEGYKHGFIDGTDCMVEIGRLREIAGKIGALNMDLYPLHKRNADRLIENDADVPAEYPVLEGLRPQPRSGGDR